MDDQTQLLLDLLDAITEVRVANPEFKASVLSSLRLTIGAGALRAGRLISLRHDGGIRAIIAQGETTATEDDDTALVEAVRDSCEPAGAVPIRAFPLGKDRRLLGVLILEAASEPVGHFLADVFLQWLAVAEFLDTEKAELVDENYQLRQEISVRYSEDNIVGVSGRFRQVVDNAKRVASTMATVLIQGETGTGKEVIARLIHNYSPRANRAFVVVNCGALNESLLETELFGHAKGAFTGAISDRKGRFEAADGGTIFLDEIGEISQAMQVRLLRVLQEMEVVRVGENRARKLDVRVIAATNRDLQSEIRDGNFREDLYFRLNVIHLQMPPLRQRPEDIPILFEFFLSQHCRRNCRYIRNVDREVFEIMRHYHWPGNVRELENYVEKMVVLAPADEISADLVPISMMAYARDDDEEAVGSADHDKILRGHMRKAISAHYAAGSSALYEDVRRQWERYLFQELLETCNNNKSKAARLLGITRNTLNARLEAISSVERKWNVD